jgi:hypothetical protein
MEDLPVFKPVVNIEGVYDPATAVEGKIYLRLVSPGDIPRDAVESDDDIIRWLHYTVGCIILVDHTGELIKDGNVGTFFRNRNYNMAVDYNPNRDVAEHVNIRRGDAASMYVDLSVLKPRYSIFG